MLESLRRYRTIGWDFDGTLFDHPQSLIFSKFIKSNPYDQTFYIVTFRSHGMQDEIDDHLLSEHGLISTADFKGVINISDEMFERYHRATRGDDPRSIANYVEWKGKVCREYGIEVMIDDNPDHVIPGCRRYDVDFLHADDVMPEV